MKFLKVIEILAFFLMSICSHAKTSNFNSDIQALTNSLKEFKLIRSREIVSRLQESKLTKQQWFQVRDILHQHPQVGLDVLFKFDKKAPFEASRVDAFIKRADKLMLHKKFKEAGTIYQAILKQIRKDKNFQNGRNYHLYWSLIHSLGRAFYGLKQYNDSVALYRTIPSSYPYYRQVQFELMWTNYMNDRLEYALGSITTIASGLFSKMLDPEVYLLQYYIYRRMCRNEEAGLVKARVKSYQELLHNAKIPLGNWIKKDVETLLYKQILSSDNMGGAEWKKLKTELEIRSRTEIERLRKEFDFVQAYIDVDSDKNKKLKPVKTLLKIDQLLASENEKWTVEDGEIWLDELGKYVFVQKDLCSK